MIRRRKRKRRKRRKSSHLGEGKAMNNKPQNGFSFIKNKNTWSVLMVEIVGNRMKLIQVDLMDSNNIV
jgi:hypothetical protein